jgi:hypothetical protein
LKLIETIASSLRRRGLLQTLSLIGKNAAHRGRSYLDGSFDRRYGTRTSGVVPLGSLTISSPNASFGVYYEATPVTVFRQLMGSLRTDITRFCYFDYGSGMGRTLLMASDYPFRFIRGIEFSQTLHSIAEQNISIYRGRRQRCHDIQSLCIDATDFQPPPEPTVFFLYNPFDAPVMKIVFQRIEESLVAHPREIHIIYYNPLSGYILDELGFMTRRREIPLRYDFTRKNQRRAIIFTHDPSAPRGGRLARP